MAHVKRAGHLSKMLRFTFVRLPDHLQIPPQCPLYPRAADGESVGRDAALDRAGESGARQKTNVVVARRTTGANSPVDAPGEGFENAVCPSVWINQRAR